MLHSAVWRKWCGATALFAWWQVLELIMRARRQNSELLAITYGALVAQLVEDYEDPAAINEQLEKMCATVHVLRCLVAMGDAPGHLGACFSVVRCSSR
jgi:hypothetical protein|eukprot:COSAG02_NODE_12711_length_1505_cov_1.527027_2_plen_98_part_00